METPRHQTAAPTGSNYVAVQKAPPLRAARMPRLSTPQEPTITDASCRHYIGEDAEICTNRENRREGRAGPRQTARMQCREGQGTGSFHGGDRAEDADYRPEEGGQGQTRIGCRPSSA